MLNLNRTLEMSILSRVPFSGMLKCPKRPSFSSRLLPRNHQTEPKNRITSYLLDKYMSLIKSYGTTLKKNFPAAVKFYKIYSAGMKSFKDDAAVLFKGFKKANSEGWESLSRKELEVYYQMPKDIIRTSPVIIVGAGVPLCGFLFIIAHYFPRQMLTYHFWSLQQRSEFSLYYHKKKLKYFAPVFKSMQKQCLSVESDPLYKPMKEVLDHLVSGLQPSGDLILSCKPLFEKSPYGLWHLPRNHISSLLKLYDMHRGWRRRQRLEFRASLIHLMDAAIIREGGLEKLSQDEIKWNCFLRGLNPMNMKQEDINIWMNTWLSISQKIDKNSYSLLLHCPILLGYNQPTNWCLLGGKR